MTDWPTLDLSEPHSGPAFGAHFSCTQGLAQTLWLPRSPICGCAFGVWFLFALEHP